MLQLTDYIIEARAPKPPKKSEWYDRPEDYTIEGAELPKSITDKIKFSIWELDGNKPKTVFVEKDDKGVYTLTFGNVRFIGGTYREFHKIIDTGTKIKTLENCVLEIRSGGSMSNIRNWDDIDLKVVGDVLRYFKDNNSDNHFSKVIFNRFNCDENCDLDRFDYLIPSTLVYFSECRSLPNFDFEKRSRKDIKYCSDKSTVNGKLKLLNLLDESNPKIKVVVKKSDREEIEYNAKRDKLKEDNKWSESFNFKELKNDLYDRFDDCEQIVVSTEYKDLGDGLREKYLEVWFSLEGIKSYGEMSSVRGWASILRDDENKCYKANKEISSSGNSVAKMVYYMHEWLCDNLYDNYGANPPLVFIHGSRLLLG